MGSEAGGSACTSTTCDAAAGALPAECPLAAKSPRQPDSDRDPHGRAYCLDDLNGGSAVRTASPRLDPPPVFAAIAATTLEAARPAPRFAPVLAVARARPPTESWRRLPPARAPPVLG